MKKKISLLITKIEKLFSTLFNYLNHLINYLNENPFQRNVSLAVFNIFLFLCLVFQFNIVGIFNLGYDGAKLLLPLTEGDVKKITLIDPDLKKSGVSQIELIRQDESLAPKANVKEEKKSWLSSLFSKKTKHFNWNLNLTTLSNTSLTVSESKINDANKKTESLKYEADEQRVNELFTSLESARRYYAIPSTPEKEKSSGLLTDSSGSTNALQIVFHLEGNKKEILNVGSPNKKGDESFVRLNNEKEIFIAKTNIRAKSGGGDKYFFRNRRFWPKGVEMNGVSALTIQTKGGARSVLQLTKSQNQWNMTFPPTNSKLKIPAIQTFLNDLFAWQISNFISTPKDITGLDSRFPSLEMSIRYDLNSKVANQESSLNIIILGRKGVNDYILQMPDQSLREVHSLNFDQILDPVKNFTEIPAKK